MEIDLPDPPERPTPKDRVVSRRPLDERKIWSVCGSPGRMPHWSLAIAHCSLFVVTKGPIGALGSDGGVGKLWRDRRLKDESMKFAQRFRALDSATFISVCVARGHETKQIFSQRGARPMSWVFLCIKTSNGSNEGVLLSPCACLYSPSRCVCFFGLLIQILWFRCFHLAGTSRIAKANTQSGVRSHRVRP